jgi:hypothetical protein
MQIDPHAFISVSHTNAFVERYVQGKLEIALNWQELSAEAAQVIAPEMLQRWQEYWKENERRAGVLRSTTDLKKIIQTVDTPKTNYSCPSYLAERAIWPTAVQPDRIRLVEAGR